MSKAKAIPEAIRLSVDEQLTAARLMKARRGLVLRESPHVGAEFVDQFGRTYDALGTLGASKFWNERQFIRSITEHLLKSNDFTVIDLTGFEVDQIHAVGDYLDSLPKESKGRIIRIGF